MTMFADHALKTLRLLPRAAMLLALLAAPVLAMPAVRGDLASTIEAPAQEKHGLGLVLLVSLQRG